MKSLISDSIYDKSVIEILSLNTLKLYQGERDIYFKKILNKFTYIIPDGQSIVFAIRLIKGERIEYISGAELMCDLVNLANKKKFSIFFLGSKKSMLHKVKENINNNYPNIRKVGYQHGYYDLKKEEEIVEKIADFKPNILFVAFGSPRKEIFIQRYKDRLNANVMMGVGGSYEVFVGDKKLDSFTKKIGLRWLMRTLQDPIRLAPRYAVCNTYFLYLLTKEIFNKKIFRNRNNEAKNNSS